MIEWLQEHNLIAKTCTCFGCKTRNMHLMRLVVTSKSSDGFRWQCRKFTRSVRWGSWFEGSHLTLQEIILVTYYWCHKVQPQHVRRALQTKNFGAVIDWYHNCRKICMELALRNDEKYGGPGGIVELCENLYSDRRNKRHGTERHEQWIICGIDRRQGKCFMVSVEDRDLETLEKIIRDHILPETAICTEYLNIYDDLKSLELTDYIVVHSTCLNDSVTNTDQLGVEYSWRSIKRKLLCPGRRSEYMMSYMAEYFYRKSVDKKQDPFISFLQVIASTYTPRSALESNTIEDSCITGENDTIAELDTYNPYEISTYTSRLDSCEAQESFNQVNPIHFSVQNFDHEIGEKNCSSYGLPLTRETLDKILELAKNSGCNNIEIKQSGTRKVNRDNDQSDQNQNVDKSLQIPVSIDNKQINNISQMNVPYEIDEISVFSDHTSDSVMETEVLLNETEHNNLNMTTSESESDAVPVDSSKLLELADHTYYAPVGYVIDDHDYL